MKASLNRLKADSDSKPNIALLGVGHPLNGDDAAGIAIASTLREAFAGSAHVLVLEAGSAPENCTGALRAFGPALVIFIDAAQMDREPGSVRWLDWRDTSGLSASTHTLPPYMLAKFLVAELGCEVALLGLQPARNTVAAPLSPVMQQTVATVCATLRAVLAPYA
jgi:hydrogenase 3 maturation protease